MGVDVKLIKPLRKIWHGRDKKITHDELCQITKMINVRRTNQEERDAALLAWEHAGLPIRIPIKR